MKTEGYYASSGEGRIHYCIWTPDQEPRAVLQIVHGIGEYVDRYDRFAEYLNSLGYVVLAEDHMGHGKSILDVPGYFSGGWFCALEDSYQLLTRARKRYPDLPFVLMGHSMGSFLVRSILCRYPDCGITAAVLSGTGWQNRKKLMLSLGFINVVCKLIGEKTPSPFLDKCVFGSYNKRIEHKRTGFDWLSRDPAAVDAYIANPLCGFTPTAGLFRELIRGLIYIERPQNLQNMNKTMPLFLAAGQEDPVGNYGKGVERTVRAFREAGLQRVDMRLYPYCRHEILNEINNREVYEDITGWLQSVIFEK